MPEDQAEEAIAFAEEAAERVEAEQRAAKAAAALEAPAGIVGHAVAPIRPTAAQRAAELFADAPTPVAPAAPKPTLDSLFGPETTESPAESATEEPVADVTVEPAEHPAPEAGSPP